MRGKNIDGFVRREKLLQDLFDVWKPERRTEPVRVREAAGRVTVQSYGSLNTLPVFRTASMDGIAVRSADFAGGMPDYRSWKRGVDYVRADTGDDFPDEFDAVIMIEEVDFAEDGSIAYISEDISVKPGDKTIAAGRTVSEGDPVVPEGVRLTPLDITALAVSGRKWINVRKRPVVAYIPTGSELVPSDAVPVRGKNVETNSIAVCAYLKEWGAEPVVFPIVYDDKEAMREAFDSALQNADIVLLSGGSAKGEEDFSFGIVEERGELLHHYVAAAPGRPLGVGIVDGKPVINLPGPPTASFYSLQWCVSAVVAHALGIPVPEKERLVCILTEDIKSTPKLAIMCLMDVWQESDGKYYTKKKDNHRETLPACLRAEAMYTADVGESVRHAGEEIEVELLRGREWIPRR